MKETRLSETVEKRLRREVRGEVCTDTLTRVLYSTDASIYQIVPLAVVFPETVEDLQALAAIATETRTPLIARGAGTGLAGETVGCAIVADCSRHLNAIEDIDAEAGLARVQPGVVLERLNARLAPMGLRFGPDPGSATRATLGGMTANNSAGMHSLIHGTTRDNIKSLDLVLSDGSLFGTTDGAAKSPDGSTGACIVRGVADLLSRHADLIEDRAFRHLKRHRAGYLLQDVLPPGGGAPDLARLICGSEGTLALISSITLRLSDVLGPTGLGLFAYARVADAGDAVPVMLGHHPASIEMLDETILRMAREAGRVPAGLVPPDAKSILMVEFEGETAKDASDRLARLAETVRRETALVGDPVLATDEGEKQRIWGVRSSAEPLVHARPGHSHPITLFEDIAVSPDRLGDYVREIDKVFDRLGVYYAAFGHAGVGLLHTRPFFDLRDPAEREKAHACADEVYDIALSMGGTISGEHGDGLTRTQYLHKQFGDLYPVFGEIKRLFDPAGVLNPGKIWRDPPADTLLENLKYRPLSPEQSNGTVLVWREGEFENELERCNACGECRVENRALNMCPSFKITRDERSSPRAKANLMRALMNGTLPAEWMSHADAKAVMDTCINCKGCHLECPLLTNIPKLMLEAKARYAGERGFDRATQAMIHSDASARLGALAAGAANPSMRLGIVRRILQSAAGIDARRQVPGFVNTPLDRFREACPHPEKPSARVALFLDIYARYNAPDLAFDFLDILRALNVEAVVPDQQPSGLPAISYGAVNVARRTVQANGRAFAPWIEKGYRVVATEPSAALALREEALDYSDDPTVRTLAENATDAMTFLDGLRREGAFRGLRLDRVSMAVGYHTPCHVRAMNGAREATLNLMGAIPGLEVIPVSEGCCGIAGTWGMKHENYEKSMRMAEALGGALRDDRIERGASECSTCRMQMEEASGKPAVHPLSLLALAVRGVR